MREDKNKIPSMFALQINISYFFLFSFLIFLNFVISLFCIIYLSVKAFALENPFAEERLT